MSTTLLTDDYEVANDKKKESPGKDSLPARVFQIDSASSVWAQIGPVENCAAFDKYLDSINLTCEGFGDEGRGVAKPPPVNSLVALMDPNTGKWERAKVTAVGSAGNEFDVLLIDTGECRKGNVRDVCNREVPQLLKMAAQAVQCRLVGINQDRCTQNTTDQLKQLFDLASEVKVVVYSVPRKHQCNAAFFVKINGQWTSVATALSQSTFGSNGHPPVTTAEGIGSLTITSYTPAHGGTEATSPPCSPPRGDSPRPATTIGQRHQLPENTFAECALNEDAQQPSETAPESPPCSPPPPSLKSPPSHPMPPAFVAIRSGGSVVAGQQNAGNIAGVGSGDDIEGTIPEAGKDAGKDTKGGGALVWSSSSSDGEWDETLLVPHMVPPPKETLPSIRNSRKHGGDGNSFGRKVFGHGAEDQQSRSKGLENQFNQLMLSGSGRYTHGHNKHHPGGKGKGSQTRFGGHRGAGRGAANKRPLHYGDEVGETPSGNGVSMVGVKVTRAPVKTSPPLPKGEESVPPCLEEKGLTTPSFFSPRTTPVLKSDRVDNDISWYSYRVEQCIRKLLDSTTTATELNSTIQKIVAEDNHVQKLRKLAGNEKVVLVVVKALIEAAITTKTSCTDVVVQTILHFCSSGHLLSETHLVLQPVMDEITSDSLISSSASDTWKYRRSFSCFFTSMYLQFSQQNNNSVLSSTVNQLVRHYLDKWSNAPSAEQPPAPVSPPNAASIECLVSLLAELGPVLDKQDRKTLDVYFDGVLKELILSDGLQRSAKEALYNQTVLRREWLCKNDLTVHQEKQLPPSPPPPPPQCSSSGDTVAAGMSQRVSETRKDSHSGLGPTGSSHSLGPTGSSHSLGSTGSFHLLGPTGSSHLLGSTGSSHLLGPTGSSHSLGSTGSSHLLGPTGSSHSLGPTSPSHPPGLYSVEAAMAAIPPQFWPPQTGHGDRFVRVEGNSTPYVTAAPVSPAAHVSAPKDPYGLVKKRLEELQCPQLLPKFVEACFQDVVLERCDHKTVQKTLLDMGVPMGVVAYILEMKERKNREEIDHTATDTLWTGAQQHASVAVAPQQYMVPSSTAYSAYSGCQAGSPSVSHVLTQQMAPVYMPSPLPTSHLVPLPYNGDHVWKSQPVYQEAGTIQCEKGNPPMSRVQLRGNQKIPGLPAMPEIQQQPPPPPSQPCPPPQQQGWMFGKTLCVVCGSETHTSHSCPRRSEKLFVHH